MTLGMGRALDPGSTEVCLHEIPGRRGATSILTALCVTKKPIKTHIIAELILSNIKEQNFNKGVALNLSWQELIIKVQ